MGAGEDSAQPPDLSQSSSQVVHATCVAVEGGAVLIRGAAGTGKSALALQMIALGARLVADDRTRLWCGDGCVMADAPETIRGQIEARGVGILRTPSVGPCAVALVVDMDTIETDRLPEARSTDLMGRTLPLLRKNEAPHFPAAVMLYVSGGALE